MRVTTNVSPSRRKAGPISSYVGSYCGRRSSRSTPARQPVSVSWTCWRSFAEFETNLRKERQLEGIAEAKAEGKYKGRRPSVDIEAVRKLRAEGLGATEIAERLGIGRASVYRAIEAK